MWYQYKGERTINNNAQVANRKSLGEIVVREREVIFHHVLNEGADTVRPV